MGAFILSFLFLFQVQASQPVPKMGSYEFVIDSVLRASTDEYQLGDEWGKLEATNDLIKSSSVLTRVSEATARIGGATGFLLGEFNGEVVVATNHHVCSSSFSFSCRRISFPKLNLSFSRKAFLGTWKEIDLTLMTLKASGEEKRRLLQVAENFDFEKALEAGTPLVTSGFGIAGNNGRKMMINFDSDCRVTSADEEFRLMADPDQKNPGSYKAWSFANACDVSHGDSGSAMVDAATGSPIGIIWTGRIPKSMASQSSANIAMWEKNQSKEVWTELSYAVPAKKIREVLQDKINSGEISSQYEDIIQGVIK